MKTGQKTNAQAGYERRSREIDEAATKADIIAEPVA
jgi:hypothetical protein